MKSLGFAGEPVMLENISDAGLQSVENITLLAKKKG